MVASTSLLKCDHHVLTAGLPEEVNITQEALANGYAVIAVSSQARTSHRCWQEGADIPIVGADAVRCLALVKGRGS